ncbi:hypothetical protein NHX12_002771 [Muraenolepis orangiensis]|uniref:Uncharacterized protein n=1 Tax=Muraenolepis orangiensis TaxID=630683 RepID=A0A9Q0DXV0_9TELE|nr:hypothetical protein NHX12_002771 [Muraenolepis orangiensis]
MKTSKPETKPADHHKTIKPLSSTFAVPSHNALARVLPEERQPVVVSRGEAEPQDPPQRTGGATQSEDDASLSNLRHTYQVHQTHKRPPLPDFKEEENIAERIDLEPKDVESYRSAMDKMAEDIIALKTRVVTLEAENSRLRSDLSLHRDLGQQLLDDTDIDVMTKAEIADRIAYLKFTLASETTKAATHRDKVQQLQNELIRRNDNEKEYVKLQKAYQEQQEQVQRCQCRVAKVAGLEATVKQQEKVIEKLEKASEVFPEEDRHLLLHKVETSDARIRTLETQLEENCRLWGEEKQEMLTRLSETRHGLG